LNFQEIAFVQGMSYFIIKIIFSIKFFYPSDSSKKSASFMENKILIGKGIRTLVLSFLAVLFSAANLAAQVTTSSISGVVSNKTETVIGATVVAIHTPSGTRYGAITNESGLFVMPSVRVGGPYKVTVSGVGFKEQSQENVYALLGTAANLTFTVSDESTVIDAVDVVSKKSDVFSNNRTGAASTVNSEQLAALPTIGSRSLNDFTKYNPQGNGRSFNGQDPRLNSITIDGSVFNNGFGLGGSSVAGGRTGSSAISLDAIEAIQINVAPFDVRQSGFVGAGVNAVTRSGSNDFSASVYTTTRNQDFVGKTARNLPVSVTNFSENVYGFRAGGAIIKNKLFYFVNAESQRRIDPGTLYGPNGSTTAIPTRVLRSDIENLSTFVQNKYGYATGGFENYDYKTNSDKFLVRLDYNINDDHKLNVRYSFHNSVADVPISNSATLGNGNRNNLTTGFSMAYENSGYQLQDNTRSIVAELNSTLGSKMSNTFIASYNLQNEDRAYKGTLFPTIDIRNAGDATTYLSVGFDPFTPSNKLNYNTLQLTDNFRYYLGKNTLTLGASYEKFHSNNLFFPGSNGVYIFPSLTDFYRIANASPTDPLTGTGISRFQYRYSALPGGAEPLQKLDAHTLSVYLQDEIKVTNNLNVTAGIRMSRISFGQTGFENAAVPLLNFLSPTGDTVTGLRTGNLPKPQILWEPRLGFNFDVLGNKTLQVRGGTGVFTGRPPFVWISNQIGNNGVLTGLIDITGNILSIRNRSGQLVNPFQPTDITSLLPQNPSLPATYEINITDSKYRFPQVWKSNLAVDYKLPYGFVATVEAMYNQNLNQATFHDYNLATPRADQTLPDGRLNYRALTTTRINPSIINAYVMRTTDVGYSRSITLKLEKTLDKSCGGMVAYTNTKTRDIMSGSSTANSNFTGAANGYNPNNLPLSISDYEIPHRIIGYASYRLNYGGKGIFGGDVLFSMGFEATQSARFSYSVGGDLNGDGVNNNDLLYVPTADDITSGRFAFATNTVAAINTTFTPAQQAAALEAFIQQDAYLNANRGTIVGRNTGILPWLTTMDFSVSKNFNFLIKEKKHTFQLRLDVLNFGNLLNSDWGVGQRSTGRQPVSYAYTDNGGTRPVFRMNTQTVTNPDGTSSTFLLRDTYVNNNSLNSVYSMQLGVRYILN
ncbi:MAG: hypothetical protein RL757_1905, partial [Bacteroidota bacterium]